MDTATSLELLPQELWAEVLLEELTRLERSFDEECRPHIPVSDVQPAPRAFRIKALRRKKDAELVGLLHQYQSAIILLLAGGSDEDIAAWLPWYEKHRAEIVRILYDRRRPRPRHKWSKYDFGEVKRRTDLAEVAAWYVQDLRPVGYHTLVGTCPWHDDRDPSFKVDTEARRWRCWGACNVGGDVFDLLVKAEGLSLGEALNILGERL